MQHNNQELIYLKDILLLYVQTFRLQMCYGKKILVLALISLFLERKKYKTTQ